MNISKHIKELARHQDITLTELADKLNTSQGNLTNKLIRDNFRLSDVKDIANALNYDNIDIVLRGNNETVLIREDTPINIIKDTQYLLYDGSTSVSEEIEKYGANHTTFGEVVMILIEDELKYQYGNLWSTVIPKRLENEMIKLATGIANDVTSKFDTNKDK